MYLRCLARNAQKLSVVVVIYYLAERIICYSDLAPGSFRQKGASVLGGGMKDEVFWGEISSSNFQGCEVLAAAC